MKTFIVNFILQGWPELAAFIFTSFEIVGYKSSIRKILAYSFFVSLLVWIARLLLLPFGLHTLVAMVCIVFILYKKANVSMGSILFVVFSLMFILICLEFIMQFIMFKLGIVIPNQGLPWAVSGWPQIIGIIGIGLCVRKWIRPFYLNKYKNKDVSNG